MVLVVLLVLTGCSGTDGGAARDQATTTTTGGVVTDRSQDVVPGDDDEEPVADDQPAVDPAPDLDAVLAKVLDRAGDDPAVRKCLEERVPVEPEVAQAIARGGVSGDEATVSVVRNCRRVVELAEAWIGDADRDCVASALSSSPEDVVQAFHSSVVAPEGDAGETAGVEDLSKRLKECGS